MFPVVCSRIQQHLLEKTGHIDRQGNIGKLVKREAMRKMEYIFSDFFFYYPKPHHVLTVNLVIKILHKKRSKYQNTYTQSI